MVGCASLLACRTLGSEVIRAVLVLLDALVALSAGGGGVALAFGFEGGRFAPDLLNGTPFASYVVPGLILAIVVGGSAAFAAATTALWPRVGPTASAGAGLVLMGWIAGEVLILSDPRARSWFEAIFFAVGLSMATLGLIGARIPGSEVKQR